MLIALDHTNKHPANATVMKETKSTNVKKALDEESKKLTAMPREQIKNTRKKLGPLDNLKRVQLEEKMTSKMKAAGEKERTPTWGRNPSKYVW